MHRMESLNQNLDLLPAEKPGSLQLYSIIAKIIYTIRDTFKHLEHFLNIYMVDQRAAYTCKINWS